MIKTLPIYLFLLFSGISQAAVGNLTSQQLIEAQKQGVVVIDIRTPQEWADDGIIPGSKKIMFFNENRQPMTSEFMLKFEKLVTTKDQAFILVCRSGTRTGVAAQFLEEQAGYTKAAHLAKGMQGWIAEKRETEK